MNGVEVNYLAVVVAAVAAMIVGALWYSPVLFGKAWAKATGKNLDEMGKAGPAYALTALGSLVTSYVLFHVLSLLGSVETMPALTTAFWLWLGFVAPAFGAEHLFGGQSKELYAITAGHHLASLLVMSVVLSYYI